MKKRAFDFAGILSVILILISQLISFPVPYGSKALMMIVGISLYWLWTKREEISELKWDTFSKYRPIFEVGFLSSFGYLFGRYLVLGTSLASKPSILLKIFRFTDLPSLVLLLSALFLVVYSKPKRTVIDDLENKISAKLAIIIVAALAIIGFGLRSYQLGKSDIRGDEFQVVSAATGYARTGEFYRWDWLKDQPVCLEKNHVCQYTRAWPHSWLIAQTYQQFGISEATSRIPSVVFGVLLIGVSYLLSAYLAKSRVIGLLTAFLVTISPSYISLSRYTRMYILLLPLFALLIYVVLRALHGKWPKNNNLTEFLPYHWLYVILCLPLLYLNYHIHINSLVLIPAVVIYAALMFALRRNRTFAIPAVIGLSALAAAVLLTVTGIYNRFGYFLTWFGRENTAYLNHIFEYPLSVTLFSLLLIAAVSSLVFYGKDRLSSLKLSSIVFLVSLLGFGSFFFIFLADRYVSFVYTSHLTLFALIATFIIVWIILRHLSQHAQVMLLSTIVLGAIFIGSNSVGDRYDGQGTAFHSRAYQVIIEQYNPDTDILFTQYGRDYYLRGIQNPTMVSMLNNKLYSLEDFVMTASQAGRIWASWETGKTYHLRPELVKYIDTNFEKLHGSGIDTTKVEVYFCEDSKRCLVEPTTTSSGELVQPELPPDQE